MNRQARHRWWKERDEPTGTESDLGRLARINARASVPVEVAGDRPVGGHSAVAGHDEKFQTTNVWYEFARA